MTRASQFVIFGSLCVMVLARPTEMDDIFAEYSRSVNLYNSEKLSHVVKRRIYEDNPDVGSEKVSLKSLIGDLEQNLIKTASTLANIQSQSTDDDETNPISENHSILKRKTESTKAVDIIPHKEGYLNSENITTTESIETTTDNTSTMEVGSTRMPISLESSYGDLPVLPAFNMNQSTFRNGNSDAIQQLTHTTTNTKTHELVKEIEENHLQIGNNDQAKASHDSNNRVTEQHEIGTVATTTAPKKTAEELKESEAELKEKVAEIEAEPVILSARV